MFLDPHTSISFEHGDRRLGLKIDDYLVMQGVLIPRFVPPLHSANLGDLRQPIGLDIPHAEDVGLVDNQTAEALVKDYGLDVARLHEDEAKDDQDYENQTLQEVAREG